MIGVKAKNKTDWRLVVGDPFAEEQKWLPLCWEANEAKPGGAGMLSGFLKFVCSWGLAFCASTGMLMPLALGTMGAAETLGMSTNAVGSDYGGHVYFSTWPVAFSLLMGVFSKLFNGSEKWLVATRAQTFLLQSLACLVSWGATPTGDKHLWGLMCFAIFLAYPAFGLGRSLAGWVTRLTGAARLFAPGLVYLLAWSIAAFHCMSQPSTPHTTSPIVYSDPKLSAYLVAYMLLAALPALVTSSITKSGRWQTRMACAYLTNLPLTLVFTTGIVIGLADLCFSGGSTLQFDPIRVSAIGVLATAIGSLLGGTLGSLPLLGRVATTGSTRTC